MSFTYKRNVRENLRGDQEWSFQRHKHMAQDTERRKKTHKQTILNEQDGPHKKRDEPMCLWNYCSLLIQ